MNVLDYMNEEYPNLLKRMAIEANQKDMDPHKVLPVGTTVFPIRNGFGSSFGGFLKVIRHNPQNGKCMPYMSINYEGNHSSKSLRGYVLSYESWYRDVMIVEGYETMSRNDRDDFWVRMETIYGRR